MQLTIRSEGPADLMAIRQVNVAAFQGEEEARLIDELREQGFQRISLVAEVDGLIVGHIYFSELRVVLDTGTLRALALAPMAVHPSHQRKGMGSALVRHGLDECREQAYQAVIVLGHPDFYPRFGFSSELAKPLQSPYSGEAWMAIELVEGALRGRRGTVFYPPPFGGLEHEPAT